MSTPPVLLDRREPIRRVVVSRPQARRPAPAVVRLPVAEGITFVEGLDARVAGGLMVVSAASLAGVAAVALLVVVGLFALEAVVPGSTDSAGGLPGALSGAPTSSLAVARSADSPSANGRAAKRSGDVGPDALAPEVAPVLPASGAVTPVPRGGDGPPEGSLE